MASKNVETALTYLRAGLIPDNETCARLLGESFTWTDRAQGYVAKSVEELVRSAEEHAGWHDRVLEVECVSECDDRVFIQGTLTQTHMGTWRSVPPTGRRVRVQFCDIIGFDSEGRIISEDSYQDVCVPETRSGVLTCGFVRPGDMPPGSRGAARLRPLLPDR